MRNKILDIIDFEQVNTLLEGFNKTTGFVTAILDLDGNILSKSGWRQICTEFHRVNPETSKKCTISDTELAGKLAEGEKYHFYKCLNGLVDVAVPVVINGEHIANLFSGQFFFEEPDKSFFLDQAKKYGFNDQDYLEALEKVPIVSEGKVKTAMVFLLNMTQLISELTFQKMQQTELDINLLEGERHLHNSQKIAHIGSWRLDLETNQVIWTEELYKMYGFDPSLPPPPYTEHMKLFTPESWEKLSTSLANTRATGIPYELELETVKKDGNNGWMWVRGEAIQDPDSKIIGLWGAAQDITKRKQAEFQLQEKSEAIQMQNEEYLQLNEELLQTNDELNKAKERTEESEAMLRAAMENSQAGIAIAEFPSGKLKYVNKAALMIRAKDYDEVVKDIDIDKYVSSWQILHFDGTPFESDEVPLARAILYGETNSREFIVRRDNNDDRYVWANAAPIFNDRGIQTAAIVIFLDITERKHLEVDLIKARDKAEESDRLKSAFLANMSHEIRTPMNGILGFTELLKDPDLKGDEQDKYISVIETSGIRLLNIINDIIIISKIESSQFEIYRSETNINEQIEFLYAFFKPEAEQKGLQIKIRNSLPANECILNTDKEKVYAVLTNLVKNALKFTQQGSIEFGYEKKGKFLEFFVRDTGMGILPEQKNFIFERFSQGTDFLNKKQQGAGLGLSISKGYVEMLGGKIWVESKAGVGSTFYFTLPCFTETENMVMAENTPSTEELPGAVLNNQSNKLKILIAEDDEASEMFLTIASEKFSRDILIARTGVEAVQMCQENLDLDLILMDIQMPGISGYEATRQVRKFNKEVIIIAQTAFAMTGEREKALEAGCNDYISKPIKQSELKDLVTRHCL